MHERLGKKAMKKRWAIVLNAMRPTLSADKIEAEIKMRNMSKYQRLKLELAGKDEHIAYLRGRIAEYHDKVYYFDRISYEVEKDEDLKSAYLHFITLLQLKSDTIQHDIDILCRVKKD